MRLKDKIILVTGGSGLLGTAIVQQLKAEGAKVLNVDINATTTADLSVIQADITDGKSINDLVVTVKQHFGRIDGLVNNAYPRTKDWGVKFEDIPYDSWKKNVDVQMNSLFYLCQQVTVLMKKQGSGSIVNMASIYGVVGPDFTVYDDTGMTMPAAYSAIKGGVVNFTRYLAAYMGPYNIRVNCVSPGGIFDNQPPVFVDNYNKKVPMGRMGLPADIAPSVAFLLSDESSYITGQNLIVDGGWTCI
ncbi:SDR family oxidoreductase [Chitinophaga oryziterrae]|uniref:SDR family oxidoreductase n=1 Tax=Chitinophaga oryziterrae TaxID=1031224 RepID=A0A6N8J4W2_9BACT|nr:oxidoreductase [Chitinophaga oryziterrae]MVT39731.1 SDR family oxidoreductase [Chitinophaga oryziterrae]